MTYSIKGLNPQDFTPFFALSDAALRGHRARRVTATANRGFPCRVSLRDANEGDSLLLIHHVNHDVDTPFRNAYAIYIRADAHEPGYFVDEVPPVMESRTMALRGYSSTGLLEEADIAIPGQADETIRHMLENTQIAYIDAHNAAPGCFAARVTRHD